MTLHFLVQIELYEGRYDLEHHMVQQSTHKELAVTAIVYEYMVDLIPSSLRQPSRTRAVQVSGQSIDPTETDPKSVKSELVNRFRGLFGLSVSYSEAVVDAFEDDGGASDDDGSLRINKRSELSEWIEVAIDDLSSDIRLSNHSDIIGSLVHLTVYKLVFHPGGVLVDIHRSYVNGDTKVIEWYDPEKFCVSAMLSLAASIGVALLCKYLEEGEERLVNVYVEHGDSAITGEIPLPAGFNEPIPMVGDGDEAGCEEAVVYEAAGVGDENDAAGGGESEEDEGRIGNRIKRRKRLPYLLIWIRKVMEEKIQSLLVHGINMGVSALQPSSSQPNPSAAKKQGKKLGTKLAGKESQLTIGIPVDRPPQNITSVTELREQARRQVARVRQAATNEAPTQESRQTC
ncbi:hypothetical protein CCACVL1_20213 [Corchorus capsularis]|uniref:Uncharacterized protein n=1 Tax=Corchorus capsularis TaxID=210143 RepID=A0A1R3HC31_COCAP|nr:hypothetical protein CCACVL1_20213 [Corchorus capsularis]